MIYDLGLLVEGVGLAKLPCLRNLGDRAVFMHENGGDLSQSVHDEKSLLLVLSSSQRSKNSVIALVSNDEHRHQP